MSLFSIERYNPEEESASVKEASKALSILDKIHEQAKSRKQALKEDPHANDAVKPAKRHHKESESPDKSNLASPKAKRKKKSKDLSTSTQLGSDYESQNLQQTKVKQTLNLDKSNTINRNYQQKNKERKKATESVTPAEVEEDSERNIEDADIEGVDDDEDDSSEEVGEGEGQTHKEIGGFTVIGDVKEKINKKVLRVLPQWLSSPSIITDDIRNNKTPVADFERYLGSEMTHTLLQNKFTSLFPVQAMMIPALLSDYGRSATVTTRNGYRPSDICCSAPTGSGKTLAFVLPIVQLLKDRVVCRVRALVMLPVRDLAKQVFDVFQMFTKNTKLKVGLICGHKSLQHEQELLVNLRSGEYHSLVDIIVATPGRLVDHINNTPGVSLDYLRFLVIDEADRMVEEVSQDWLTQVERAVYRNPRVRPKPGPLTAASAIKAASPLQKLLFSATLSQNPEKLQQLNLFQPRLYTSVVKQQHVTDKQTEPQGDFIGKYTTPEGLSEYYMQCTLSEKPLFLLYFLHQLQFTRVLCFTNTAQTTRRLFWLVKLYGNKEVKEYSANLPLDKRKKILKKFSAGKIDILICTDAMARGMDIDGVRYVISYEMPPYLKTYIHRIGRTARAGKVGTAITFLQQKEMPYYKGMMTEAGKGEVEKMEVKRKKLEQLVPQFEEALKALPDALKGEKTQNSR